MQNPTDTVDAYTMAFRSVRELVTAHGYVAVVGVRQQQTLPGGTAPPGNVGTRLQALDATYGPQLVDAALGDLWDALEGSL